MAPDPNNKSDSMQHTHLTCDSCGQKIAGTYFKVDGKIYCFDCNEKTGAKPAKNARPSWAMGTVVALIILGLAGLVFYLAAGDSKTVAPVAVAIPTSTPIPASAVESPAPIPSTNSTTVQPASSNNEVHSSIPTAPTPTEALSASAVANIGEPPTETPTPAATDTPSISFTPLTSPTQ